jgi:hypothetical protein
MAEQDQAPTGGCQGTTKAGKPCPHLALAGEGFCLHHHPAKADERKERYRELGRRGAEAKHAKEAQERAAAVVNLANTSTIREALERALARVEDSDASAIEKANATARLCGVALRVVEVHSLAAEVEELRALVEKYVRRAA